MPIKQTPLHFNPLRPSRNHLEAVSWPASTKRSSDSSPFAYLHDPYIADANDAAVALKDMGTYNRDTQKWEYEDGHVEMGFYTKCRKYPSKSPPTGTPNPSTEGPDYDQVTDDVCQ